MATRERWMLLRVFFLMGLLALLVFGVELVAVAKDAKKAEPEKKDKKESAAKEKDKDEVEDEPKVLTLKVPGNLKSGGYVLKIDGQATSLADKDEVQLQPTLDHVDIELYARDGRLVDFRRDYVDVDTVNDLRLRRWHVIGFLGTAYPGSSSEFSDQFLNGRLFHILAELGYDINAFQLHLGIGRASQTRQYDEGFDATFAHNYQYLALGYEFMPFKHGSGYVKKIGAAPLLGAVHSSNRLELSDEHVSESGSVDAWGYLAGLQFKFPMGTNFTFDSRYHLTQQKIEIKKFGFNYDKALHNFLFGVGYGF